MQTMQPDEIIDNPLKGDQLLTMIAKWATIMKIRENQAAQGILNGSLVSPNMGGSHSRALVVRSAGSGNGSPANRCVVVV